MTDFQIVFKFRISKVSKRLKLSINFYNNYIKICVICVFFLKKAKKIWLYPVKLYNKTETS